MNNDIIVSAHDISKAYPGVQALDNVSLEVRRGEVHALVGENGAGKSTLIKIIAGAEHPDSGIIKIFDKEFHSLEPAQSKNMGITTVYQEFNLFPELTIAENIFMGDHPDGRKAFSKFKEWQKKATEIFNSINIDIDVNKRPAELTVAYMQLIEIAKALAKNAKIIIMDEPTAPLSNIEVESLFEIIQNLRKQGIAIIYISHRLGEIFKVADRVTVMRDGKTIVTLDTKKTNRRELIRYMINRELDEQMSGRDVKQGKVVLEAKALYGDSRIKVKDVSFKLHEGEVLGLGGLVGAGRTEVARLLFGADRLINGEIIVKDKRIKRNTPKKAVSLGIGYLPEDRKKHGAILDMSVLHNISLPVIKKNSKGAFMDFEEELKDVTKQVESLRIKTPTINQLVKNLSGGNQQKVVLAKWIASQCRILILDEPTRGVDVGAKQELYGLINEMAKQGIAILLITTEMEELLGLSDRLLVLCEGESRGFLEKKDFTQENVLLLASKGM